MSNTDDRALQRMSDEQVEQEQIATEQDESQQMYEFAKAGLCPLCGGAHTAPRPSILAKRDREIAAAMQESERALARYRESAA